MARDDIGMTALPTTTGRPSATATDFAQDGVTHLRGLLTPDEIEEIRATFMAQVESDPSIGNDDGTPADDILTRYPRFIHPHRHTDLPVGRLARRWMLDDRVVEPLEALVGPVLAAQSMFYFKPPTARGQALHQDNIFLQAHPETCYAVWIAVDHCDEANGALKVVPGSHRQEIICPEEADETESFTTQGLRVPEGMRVDQTRMEAGDALIFHGSLVHGSGPNRTLDRYRRSLIFHYVPQGSQEVARHYQPLLDRQGREVLVAESADGGQCGDGWDLSSPH